jgi:nitroimidazol reductase NimA-like FMN-containing flavoprotein (pyridoxamine 5'-phosphate oxidase superfamily)
MTISASERTHVVRGAKRSITEQKTINAILDAAMICHVGFVMNGYPMVIPTCHWREGDKIYWHAHSKAKNIVQTDDQQVCMTVTLMDGLVLARSAFNHSVNYRSVMIFGKAQEITDEREKTRQFKLMIDKFSPGRWDQLRPITKTEVKATGLMELDLTEVSCKVRNEMAVDEVEDVSWPVWAGILPIEQQFGDWQVNTDTTADYALPNHPDLDQ